MRNTHTALSSVFDFRGENAWCHSESSLSTENLRLSLYKRDSGKSYRESESFRAEREILSRTSHLNTLHKDKEGKSTLLEKLPLFSSIYENFMWPNRKSFNFGKKLLFFIFLYLLFNFLFWKMQLVVSDGKNEKYFLHWGTIVVDWRANGLNITNIIPKVCF